jgi:hypothetical protein
LSGEQIDPRGKVSINNPVPSGHRKIKKKAPKTTPRATLATRPTNREVGGE